VVQATVPIFSLARDGERDAVFDAPNRCWWNRPTMT
jgi:hypothetical protein